MIMLCLRRYVTGVRVLGDCEAYGTELICGNNKMRYDGLLFTTQDESILFRLR